MKQDNYITGQEARERMFNGIKKASEIVGGTMGTGGYNGLVEVMERPGHLLTNDGITLLSALHFEDVYEEIGRIILLEAVSRANKSSGDGSSTTCVLTSAIIEEGLKVKDVSPMDIKKSLEDCLPLIEESINKQKRDITVDTVGQVATISSESEEIGGMIQEIYKQIGKTGIIHWDISKTGKDFYTIGKGITMDFAGLASPYFADLEEGTGQFKNHIRWSNPKILITKQKITTANDFATLFETLDKKGIKEIVVFCDDYEPNVIADLIRTRAVRGFKSVLVKMPTLWKDWWYIDLAKATGATVIDPNAGLSFKMMNESHLGTCSNILVDKETTYLDGILDVTGHIKALEDEATEDSLLRASRLNTKTARYFVGAGSDSALSYRRLKVEDAISASWQALQNGVVAGGGLALRNCMIDLEEVMGGYNETIGCSILKEALWSPAKQIISNSGLKPSIKKGRWWAKRNSFYMGGVDFIGSWGYDTKHKECANMFEVGIVDPANVILNSIRNAISVSASVLTCNVIIQIPRPDITEQLVASIMSKNPNGQ